MPKRVNKAFYEEGKAHYREAEIKELRAFITYHCSKQNFLSTTALPFEHGA